MHKSFDWWIIGATILLIGVGLTIQASISPSEVYLQTGFVFVGILAFFVASIISSTFFSTFAKYIYVSSVVFLVLPFIIGELTRGTFRWISIGPLNIQPSEIVKPLIIIGLAKYFSTRKLNRPREILLGGLLAIVPAVIIFLQPDLGSALVLMAGWLAVIFTAGIPMSWLGTLGISVGILFPLIWNFLKGYQKNRLLSFLEPGRDPLGTGYNLIQALVAVGSGGLVGRGLGRGTQSHLRFLPENSTDFVFASLVEELGVIGAIIVLASFGIIFWRMYTVASKTTNRFERLYVVGVMGLIFFQAFVGAGMNMGLLPVTGVPLPFISQGGSSLVSVLFSLGLVHGVYLRLKNTDALEIGRNFS
ncbi:MAG: Rod shape-determining protein RodA [Microgenomates group bacterium GW2011_GWA2_44_7]|uniref:Rod shape-determining protein RodA n=1 Tax=Candidatus Woesebacteria bacterium GW2011_GWA1_43_12 TaxID=1618557 RepID=A0A0G1F5V8_9BACT|nr:MAG: Rod shape-determining protein RodA [Candidatus Woesebacteria bacterium GW2011_GWA1_43_12]KKT75863.1 MAG: Rod shape-determining protein RodA [Microgenomates group bacterium GW2011_GWA2_44_7]KKT78516.1 MAG: Rod shape-determining protein RodA [Microgenomates group bacterium GW2011_GWB1_44_8]